MAVRGTAPSLRWPDGQGAGRGAGSPSWRIPLPASFTVTWRTESLILAARLQTCVLNHFMVSGELGLWARDGARAGALCLGTSELGPFLWGTSCACRICNSITGLHPLDARSTCPSRLANRKCLGTLPAIPRGKGGKVALGETHCARLG